MLGVFDAAYVGMGSGLNNLRKFMAHSGIGMEGLVTNPFQRAFGFACQDVWGLINHYVDNIWQGPGDLSNSARDAFKHKLFCGLLRHFDGYRIGSEGCIFSPFVIMSFIETLKVATPASVTFEGFRFWSESGRLEVLDSITVGDIARLEWYLNYLSLADDRAAGQILHASSVMVLLYQAGYLVPVAKDKVAIPNTEVYDDLQLNQLQGNTLETEYQNYICFILAPARTVGFMIQEEQPPAGNGRADVLMLPIAGPEDGLQPPSFCVIFELKRYDGTDTSDDARWMDVDNRRRVAAHVWGQTRGAETQIYDRYFANIAATAGWCRTIYVVAMTLWTNRFCMIVAKRTRPAHDGGAGRWPVRRLPDDNRSADIDMEQADLSAVQYASLDDQFGNPNTPPVRMRYRCGRLIALSI
ncbi:hypothetical protein H4R21_002676 [Coemansia helicoidea]|uniref:Uncharacterized protein n=1 Tax=Coemansia helicoidea TaxID=1286919 RepID=A0ACC1L737_9FUNG|nr:hypothetical protein H4R21_002676 [Coemansia helicoidea]